MSTQGSALIAASGPVWDSLWQPASLVRGIESLCWREIGIDAPLGRALLSRFARLKAKRELPKASHPRRAPRRLSKRSID
jgi:hypothetical protein